MFSRKPEFVDRREAGLELGEALAARDLPQPLLVLALPRGGVVVAAEVARRLSAPLDVLIVRKMPAPGEAELALGAIAEGDPPIVVLNPEVVALTRPSQAYLETSLDQQLSEIARRQRVYRGGAEPPEVRGRTVILVDDGLATGATARAAAQALHRRGAGRVILAVPVAPQSALKTLSGELDEVMCLRILRSFPGVGGCYREFHQLADKEVTDLLAQARAQRKAEPS